MDIHPQVMRVKYSYPRHCDKGFTLLELLVALLIFAVLAVMAYGGLQVVLDAQKRTETQSMRLAELQTFFAILSRDVEQMIDRGIRDNYGEARAALVGDRSSIEFTRTGWRNPAGFTRSHMQRVAYVIDDNKIVREGWQVLDRAQNSEPITTELLNDVNEIEIRFLDQDLQWQSQWPVSGTGSSATPGLPRAVEIVVDVEGWGRITRLFSVVAGFPAPATTTSSQSGS